MKLYAALTTLAAATTVAAQASADGGYYGGALGARAAGRSGAFVARADDPTAVAYNPAGLALIGGTMIMAGNRISYNGYSYTRAPTEDWGHPVNGAAPIVTFDRVSNGKPWQALEPLIAVASNLGLRDWGFALAAFAPPGASNFDFPTPAMSSAPSVAGQKYMMLSREAIFLNYTASAAWKYHDLFGVGVTAEWIAVPRLNYSLMIDSTPFLMTANPVYSNLDMKASTTGSDLFTFNAILGAWFRPVPFLQFGIAGQVVPANIETNSKLTVTPVDETLGAVKLSRADGKNANDVNITLPLPLNARVGARYRGLAGTREIFDVELDAEYETWSRVNDFTLDTHGLTADFQGGSADLNQIKLAKHWRNTLAVKLGGDVAVIPDRLALRGGAFYETAVAEAAYSNVDFPGGPMMGGSLGGSLRFGRWEVAIAYQLRHMSSVSVSEANAKVYQQVPASACKPPYDDPNTCNEHYLNQPGPVVNAGSYSATSHYVAIALLFRSRL